MTKRAKPVRAWAIRSDECYGYACVDGAMAWTEDKVPPIRHASETVVEVEIREAPKPRARGKARGGRCK